MKKPFLIPTLLLSVPLLMSACGNDSSPSSSASGGTMADAKANSGGFNATGGFATKGGFANMGGISASGGATASGGTIAQGGATASGGTGSGGITGNGGFAAGGMTWTTDGDAKALVKSGNPGNAGLVAYADKQIGSPVIGLEGTGTKRVITSPIVVPPDVIYDGKGETLTAKGMGDGSQNENQIPYFILMPGAGIKNVTMTAPGTEGVHMMGNNTLENIVWEDVGEDAGSTREYFPGGYIYIEGGSVKAAADKVFQCNTPCKVVIKDFKATDINKLVRQGDLLQNKPGGEVPIEVILDNVTATNVKTALVMCNELDCTLMTRGVSGSPLTKGGVKKIPWVDGASDRPTK